MLEPLRITAEMAAPIAIPMPCILDGPLWWACVQDAAERADCDPADLPWLDPRDHLPITIERSGRHWISRCSDARFETLARETAEWSKKTDWESYIDLGDGDRAISLKSNRYRIHRQPLFLTVTDRIVWHCVGDKARIVALLSRVRTLHKKRAWGHGAIAHWQVQSITEDLSLRNPDGTLARPVPLHHNRLGRLIEATRTAELQPNPPYWTHHAPSVCAIAGRWR